MSATSQAKQAQWAGNRAWSCQTEEKENVSVSPFTPLYQLNLYSLIFYRTRTDSRGIGRLVTMFESVIFLLADVDSRLIAEEEGEGDINNNMETEEDLALKELK